MIAFMTALVTVIPALAVEAMWSVPDAYVPISRLIENGEEYLSRHPDDAVAWYRMGRFHSYAYAEGDRKLSIYGDMTSDTMPREFGWDIDSPLKRGTFKEVSEFSQERVEHLRASIRHYDRALALSPEVPLYWIGLAWVSEEAARHAPEFRYARMIEKRHRPEPIRQIIVLKGEWIMEALGAYRTAFDLLRAKGIDNLGFRDAIYFESARAIKRLLVWKGKLSVLDKFEIARIDEILGPEYRSSHMITPIIFPGGASRSFSKLLAPSVTSTFNLDGSDTPTEWPWVRPDTGFLVWDPAHTGMIASGRQLFGSVTWWMFWENGYQALAALDDNHDQWLRGSELAGIAVWFDRNSNAISDPGEVIPAAAFGIRGIAVRATHRFPTGEPYAAMGLELRGARYLPTYDWTPRSAPSTSAK